MSSGFVDFVFFGIAVDFYFAGALLKYLKAIDERKHPNSLCLSLQLVTVQNYQVWANREWMKQIIIKFDINDWTRGHLFEILGYFVCRPECFVSDWKTQSEPDDNHQFQLFY